MMNFHVHEEWNGETDHSLSNVEVRHLESANNSLRRNPQKQDSLYSTWENVRWSWRLFGFGIGED